MSREAIEQMVGRAIVDREFRTLLLACPLQAAESYELTEFERRLLGQIGANGLDEFARQLEYGLSVLPLPERYSGQSEHARRFARRATA